MNDPYKAAEVLDIWVDLVAKLSNFFSCLVFLIVHSEHKKTLAWFRPLWKVLFSRKQSNVFVYDCLYDSQLAERGKRLNIQFNKDNNYKTL